MHSVPELKVWNANVVNVAAYYRTSGLRIEELEIINPNSTYNMLFSELRTSSSEETLVKHWNGVPTSCHHPRPAVEHPFTKAQENEIACI